MVCLFRGTMDGIIVGVTEKALQITQGYYETLTANPKVSDVLLRG